MTKSRCHSVGVIRASELFAKCRRSILRFSRAGHELYIKGSFDGQSKRKALLMG